MPRSSGSWTSGGVSGGQSGDMVSGMQTGTSGGEFTPGSGDGTLDQDGDIQMCLRWKSHEAMAQLSQLHAAAAHRRPALMPRLCRTTDKHNPSAMKLTTMAERP